MRSELFDVALSEEKSRALNITAAWLALDRCNYILNGACVTLDGLLAVVGYLHAGAFVLEQLARQGSIGALP